MTVQTEGFDEFYELLVQMGEDFGYRNTTRNVLTPSVKAAMEPVLATAKLLARVDSGAMRDSLRVEARIPTERDYMSEYVDANDAVIGAVTVKQSRVSLSEEFGTADKAGKPFLRPALETMQGQVLRRLESLLAFRLSRYQAKQAKAKK